MLPRYLEPALDFFDAFLSGQGRPRVVPRVRWHLGNDGWHESPIVAAARRPRGACSTSRPWANCEGEPGTARRGGLVARPTDLVPSTIVDPFSFLFEYPDEGAVAARADVAVFTSEPLAEPMTLAGRVVAHLRVGSDGPSMCVHVKLVDVAPGRALPYPALRPGVRGATRDGTAPVQVVSGAHRPPRCRGHRLRLQVASSDYPLYVPHPGTSESPWFAVETAANRQRVLTGGSTPSHVSFTVLEA